MQAITLNITNLNNSLQVGDAVYTATPVTQPGSNDAQGFVLGTSLGDNNFVGILRNITFNGDGTITLDVDDTIATMIEIGYEGTPSIVNIGDFIMFSKWDQTDGDLIGYYAQARFSNSSNKKAELFSVGSEVVLNSK